jgi:hypothetical protein
VDAEAYQDTLTALVHLLELNRRRTSGSLEEVLDDSPDPSEALARPALDRLSRVDELDFGVDSDLRALSSQRPRIRFG